MKPITIGVELTDDGLDFFGLDEVNALLAQGQQIAKIEPGQIIVEEEDEDPDPEDEEAGYTLVGLEMEVHWKAATRPAQDGESRPTPPRANPPRPNPPRPNPPRPNNPRPPQSRPGSNNRRQG